jgi:integrase
MMVERSMLDVNPANGIKKLAEDIGGNTAYTLDQIEVLKKALQAKDKRLWLFVSFMLYGFIRPAEIGRLQVKNIDLQKNEIFLPGTITKNRKPRHVKISAPFRSYIDQLNLSDHHGNDFIFGYNLQTGTRHIQKNYASKSHTDVARSKGIDLSKEYTLYSWKHTGVVLHYKAGIDIKTLQAQIGHQSLQETDIYLKSLNLYTNTEIQDKSPVI